VRNPFCVCVPSHAHLRYPLAQGDDPSTAALSRGLPALQRHSGSRRPFSRPTRNRQDLARARPRRQLPRQRQRHLYVPRILPDPHLNLPRRSSCARARTASPSRSARRSASYACSSRRRARASRASFSLTRSTASHPCPPFSPPPKDAPPLNLPFLRYIFRQYVLTFPFMAAAPKDFYSEKLQPFIASVLSRNLAPTSILDDSSEGSEQAARIKVPSKIERNLSLFLGAATKLVEPEDVVRLSQVDLDRLEALAKKQQARAAKVKDIFQVNIVSVRTVPDKGRMRSRVHKVRISLLFLPLLQ
jgi:hypothetical protein